MKLKRCFYSRDTLTVAQELLGKVLVHNINGKIVSGRIVETEAYLGVIDKAAHSYGGKRTQRVEVMYGSPGRTYIYLIYGMYDLFNVVTKEEGTPEAVLIRGIEPLDGIEVMAKNRYNRPLDELAKRQILNLTNGPGKLCVAMDIDRALNGEDLCGDILYIENRFKTKFNVITDKRVGVDYAEEAKDFPFRFYIEGNKYVSKILKS